LLLLLSLSLSLLFGFGFGFGFSYFVVVVAAVVVVVVIVACCGGSRDLFVVVEVGMAAVVGFIVAVLTLQPLWLRVGKSSAARLFSPHLRRLSAVHPKTRIRAELQAATDLITWPRTNPAATSDMPSSRSHA